MSSSSENDSSSDDETFVPNDVHDSSDGNNDSGEEREDDMKKEDVDKLWESFKKDTAREKSAEGTGSLRKEPPGKVSTVKVTKVYDFAGEEVKVTEEVAKDKVAKTISTPNHGLVKMKRPGGLHGVLGKMSKKPKLSTLEKSKLDWNTFKDEEGIADDLKFHNKGKNGFLEKKFFLERTDNRQFEKERDVRLSKSSKR